MSQGSVSRRRFVQFAGTAVTGLSLAGCQGRDGGSGENVFIPGIYDLSGATGEVGTPGSYGSRDAIAYINDSDFLGETTIEHEWVDYSYEIEQARQAYDRFSQQNPPAILGWGTPDTEGLAPQVARDEIVYVSGSYSENLMCPETDYNFYPNLDYSSQNRALLQWIADNDAGATVATVTDLNNPFGTQVESDTEEYASNVDVSHEGFVSLPLGASSATGQVSRLEEMGVDYVIGHLTAAPFQALIQDVRSAGLDVELLGTTWSMDESRTQGAPDVYEGARTVNAFKTMDQVLQEDTRGSEAIQEAWSNNRDDAIEESENANLNYVRGFLHALTLAKAIKNAKEAENDPSDGADLRDGVFAITDWDAWGLALPLNFQENDRRATMQGVITQTAENGELVTDTTTELPRNEEWITEGC